MIQSIVSLFPAIFDEVDRDQMETFVEQIQQSRVQDKETEVKVKGKHAIFPAGKIIQINCKANV